MLEVRRENTRDGFAPLLLTRCIRRAVALACAVKSGEVEPRPGNQGGQPGDEVQRLQHHVGQAVSERLFVLVHNPTPTIDGQPFCGNAFNGGRWPLPAFGKPQPSPRLRWRAGDVSAQAFQAAPLMGLTHAGGMQGETGGPGQQRNV